MDDVKKSSENKKTDVQKGTQRSAQKVANVSKSTHPVISRNTAPDKSKVLVEEKYKPKPPDEAENPIRTQTMRGAPRTDKSKHGNRQ